MEATSCKGFKFILINRLKSLRLGKEEALEDHLESGWSKYSSPEWASERESSIRAEISGLNLAIRVARKIQCM